MSELLLLFGRLLEFLGWGGNLALWSGVFFLSGVRVIRSGFRGVYFRFGTSVQEVSPGVHWRPFPFYRLTVLFCQDQTKDLHGQEVVTKDGITCTVKGSISYRVKDLLAMVTTVFDADEQLLWEVMAEIREWVSDHTYADCIATELGRKIIPAAVQRAKRWGIDVRDINVVAFAPANPEARTLVFLLDVAQKRAKSATILLEAIVRLEPQWRAMGMNPSVVLASLAGVPMTVVGNAEQFSVLREDVASIALQLDQQKPQPDTLARIGATVAEYVPGAGTLLALRDGVSNA